MGGVALKITGAVKSFSGVEVLHGVHLEVNQGEIFGLVGENGAGKSTMMNILGGIIKKDTGQMEVFGKEYNPSMPSDAVKVGIAFVHQELNLFSNLTVAENMFIEDFPKNFFGTINYRKINSLARERMDQYGISAEPETKINALSAGVRQMIEILKALMKSPRILIFDEPTTSLSYKEKEKLFATIHELKENGITIIYISHILDDVFALCNRVSVLRDGYIISTENVEGIDKDALINKLVGREMNQIYPVINKKIGGRILLETRNISNEKVKDISIQVLDGEIVGIYGLMGAGRTEFLRAVYGVDTFDGGEVFVKSKKVEKPSPFESISRGIAFVTEDRHQEGLLLQKPVGDNLPLVVLPTISEWTGIINRKKETKLIEKAINDLLIKTADFRTQTADSLSGGNQQKVVFGKWVINKPDIFFLDEPTRGVDIGAKFEIYNIIIEMAAQGAAVVFASSEMEELIGICDRILVMKDGRITGQVNRNNYSQEAVIKLAL